ncbi:MAG: hypothetical protein KJ749_09705 [Planctomycetes bacterium]|nr:hypothetical protein [Planctomycetota bacterium]
MSQIIDISIQQSLLVPVRANSGLELRGSAPGGPASDSVEFSRLGRALARGVEESTFSLARIRAIRGQIADGTFETPERINGTVDRLLDVVG